MGKIIDPNERIMQRSIGFPFRQFLFFNQYPEFRADVYCREAIDEQISLIDKSFLSKEDQKDDEETE